MSHIEVQYHFVKLFYHVCTCTVSHVVKWISHSTSGWEKMRTAAEMERNILLPRGQAFPL